MKRKSFLEALESLCRDYSVSAMLEIKNKRGSSIHCSMDKYVGPLKRDWPIVANVFLSVSGEAQNDFKTEDKPKEEVTE